MRGDAGAHLVSSALRHDDRIALPHQLSLWTPRSERRFRHHEGPDRRR